MTFFFSKQLLKRPDGWLGAIGICFAIIHLSMIWRVGALSFAGLGLVFWCAVASLLWDKRDSLNFHSGMFASCFAIALLIPLLIKSIFLMQLSSSSLYIFPILAGFSLALLASGFRGLIQYKKELLILLILGLTQPIVFLLNNFDPSFFTARFATYLLWYGGFQIVRDGVNIHFAGSPHGVEVYPGCSGLDAICHLLSLTLLFFLMFPSDWKTKIILPLAALILGFVINGVRVALLAVIVAYHENQGFDYWHSGEGSLLFSIVSAVLLCGIAFLLVQNQFSEPKTSTLDKNRSFWE